MPPPFDPWLTGSVAVDLAAAMQAGGVLLAARRAQRLAGLLHAAAHGSPRYRRLLAGLSPAQVRLQDLPIARKSDLMADFDAWVADPALRLDDLRRFTADRGRIGTPYLGRYLVWESSGSSGEPAIFAQDARAMAVYDALEAQRRPTLRPWQRWLDPWGLLERVAFVGATGGHFASTVSIERLRRLSPALGRTLHSISFLQPTAALDAALQALSPTVVATYPSAAVLLAEEQMAGRLRIRPQELWTGGETLTPAMRRYIEQAFGCPVANSYGASEFLSLAFECVHGKLHLNSDWAILEPVDEHGHAVPEGTTGTTTLLTNLANHVQPLIRYDLGDRVNVAARPCPCGSSLPVVTVEGRNDDSLLLGGTGSRAVRVLPLAISTVLEDEAGLFDFQLLQKGARELCLCSARTGPEALAALRRGRMALARFLEAQGAVGVRVRCRSGEPARLGRSGKAQRVIGLPA